MRRLAAATGAALLVAAACGGPGDQEVAEQIVEGLLENEGGDGIVFDPDGSGSFTISGDEGGGTATFGGGSLPDGFPFPGPHEYSIASRFEFESPGGTAFSAVLEIPVSIFDTTLTMYEEFLRSEGFEVSSDSAGDGDARIVFVHGTREDAVADITMSGDPKGAIVSLTWTPSE
ncbi:MAG: hypothetical protein ACE5GC_02195 [Acidimicrobiia bacterium]